MGRTYDFRETRIGKKRGIHPIWRGIGFIILVGLTVGGFWMAGYLLELQWREPFLPFPVPRNFTVELASWLPPLPGKPLVQVGATLVLDLVAYALMVLIYGIFNPVRLGPQDAPQPRGRGNRSMTR